MRERTDLFASPEGRKFLEEIVGTGTREPNPKLSHPPDRTTLAQASPSSDAPSLAGQGTAIPAAKASR